MLGNSLIYFNDMQDTLAELTGAEVVSYSPGGAELSWRLDPANEQYEIAQNALKNEKWDYVVLQEMSNGPITIKDEFMHSVEVLCDLSRKAGATPVLYGTWAYQRDGAHIKEYGFEYEQMYRDMTASNKEAAERGGALLADVAKRFYEIGDSENLFLEDGYHPNERGSQVAAEVIAETILNHYNNK